ncbi:hypothetical protein [Robertkochia solimangrovi]|uniref:hypothetical protein n=1 Tax=Robertkochia solimangrovi TaxID=2213046 RepID=UPI00117D90BA|nr:hypothetical protein [Robertkochia solimangrovi]
MVSKTEPEKISTGKIYCDFDNEIMKFRKAADSSGINYIITKNPSRSALNPSELCGHINSGNHENTIIISDKLNTEFNFRENGYVFKIKIYADQKGSLDFKIENGGGQVLNSSITVLIDEIKIWKEYVFDFSEIASKPASGEMCKFILSFTAKSGSEPINWYFDDISGPANTPPKTLFKRYSNNPILKRESSENPDWRNLHVANAAILEPENTPDGKWRMYVRGSGNVPDYHDQIGLLYQETDNFSPFGPWIEYPQNPVIHHGSPGTYNDLHMLDCAPVMGMNNQMFLFFLAKSYGSVGALAGSKSDDMGFSFQKFQDPIKDMVGCSDAIYFNDNYYLFYGDGHYDGKNWGNLSLYVGVTEDPEELKETAINQAIAIGGGPENFDSYSVNGSRIFRLKGIDLWFMCYQGSRKHFDFPNRFHIAYSKDLVHWTKVNNDLPLFERGAYGEWDQGGIWYGEIFEYEDMLYMYYEGWGAEQNIADRDVPYFSPGGSQTGAAYCTKQEFLEWLNIEL